MCSILTISTFTSLIKPKKRDGKEKSRERGKMRKRKEKKILPVFGLWI
jgi:hypothetical protein